MKKYSVSLNAYGSWSTEIEASSPEEALKKAQDEADLSEGELYDWDHENLGEVTDLETNEAFDANDLSDKSEE